MPKRSVLFFLLASATTVSANTHESVEVTFQNRLKTSCSLFWAGKLMHQFTHAGEAFSYTSYDGHAWTAADEKGEEIFHYVIRAKDGPKQEVDIRRGHVRRTIHHIVSSDDHAKHRVDGGTYMQDNVGCVDPLLIGDRVLIRAALKDGEPRLGREGHRVISRAGDTTDARFVWTLRSDKKAAGPFYPGDPIFLEADSGGIVDLQPPPSAREATPLLVRWKDLGAWQRFEIHKGPAADGDAMSAVCYGDEAFLKAHTGTFVDVHDGRAMARWPHRGDWQTLAFERVVEPEARGGEL